MDMGLDRMRSTLNELWRVQTPKSCADALGSLLKQRLLLTPVCRATCVMLARD